MAESMNGPEMGEAGINMAGALRVAGAVVSLGLLVGMGVWGYKLVVRDANGIPVVRAMAGPMRDTPSNPGGTLPLNTGLAVNEVAAEGGASGPEDVLVLAPQSTSLTEEDLMTQPTAEADEVRAGGIVVTPQVQETGSVQTSLGVEATDSLPAEPSDTPMTAEQVLAFADQIAAGVDPLQALEGIEVVEPTLSVDGAIVAQPTIQRIAASVPGVVTAFRPPARPSGLITVPARADAAIPSVPEVDVSAIEALVAEAQTAEISTTAPVTVGTTLVQLGAFDTIEEARTAWSGLTGRFAEFMVGKDLVVQEASSGGAPFYRLRATGFVDIADARRFCSVLVAEEAACIPVVVQ